MTVDGSQGVTIKARHVALDRGQHPARDQVRRGEDHPHAPRAAISISGTQISLG